MMAPGMMTSFGTDGTSPMDGWRVTVVVGGDGHASKCGGAIYIGFVAQALTILLPPCCALYCGSITGAAVTVEGALVIGCTTATVEGGFVAGTAPARSA